MTGDGEEAEARVQGDGRPLVRLRRQPAARPLPVRRVLRRPLASGRGMLWRLPVRANLPPLPDIQRWYRFRQPRGQLAVQAGR